MRQTTGTRKSPSEKIAKDIKRATRKHYTSEEKIRIVSDGLRGRPEQRDG
jgi:transposase